MTTRAQRAEDLVGTEINSDVGPIPIVAVRAGMIIAVTDGKDVDRSGWCDCPHAAGSTFFTVRGTTSAGEPMPDKRLDHGWACRACRKVR